MGYLFDVLGVLAGTGVFLTVWYQYWLRHARRYDESGYTPAADLAHGRDHLPRLHPRLRLRRGRPGENAAWYAYA